MKLAALSCFQPLRYAAPAGLADGDGWLRTGRTRFPACVPRRTGLIVPVVALVLAIAGVGMWLPARTTACAGIEQLTVAIREYFREHPDYAVITSFPGLADMTGARVLAEIGDDRARFADARALKAYAGSAPVTRGSGRRAINSASAVSVCLTNRREIAERDVDFCMPLTCSPTGSAVRACWRAATPASIRSVTTRVSTSSAPKCA
jgi:hypothetical protein